MGRQINRLFATMLMGTAACLMLTGCKSEKGQNQTGTELTPIVDGGEQYPDNGGIDGGLTLGGGASYGSELVTEVAGAGLPNGVQKMFEIAMIDWKGETLTPVNLLGTKVVAGVIYELLCIEGVEGQEHLVLADLYSGLDGTYSITSTREFNILDLKEKTDTDGGVMLSGGFTLTDMELSVEMPPVVQMAVKKAKDGLEDIEVEVMTYLGSQIVAGMKYRFLCRATKCTEGAEPALYYAAVYEDLGGNASFVDLYEIELP